MACRGMVLLLALALASCTRENRVSLTLVVPDGVSTDALELLLFDGGTCPGAAPVALGTTPSEPRARRRGAAGMLDAIGDLPGGRYSLAALVRDEACRPIAYGCEAFTLGEVDAVRVTLADPSWSMANVCPDGEACAGGRCGGGGAPDGGSDAGDAGPDGGPACEDVTLFALEDSCVRPRDCGPFGATACAGDSCARCTPTLLGWGDVSIGPGATTDVAGNRFAMVEDATHLHIAAAVVLDGATRLLRRVSFDASDLSATPYYEDAPAGWDLQDPFAVGLFHRTEVGDARVTVYDTNGTMQMCTAGFVGADPFPDACDRIFGAIDPIAQPAFTGEPGEGRQVWLTALDDLVDVTSVSWGGACETTNQLLDVPFPAEDDDPIVVGSAGRWTVIGPEAGGDVLLFDSEPEANLRTPPCVPTDANAAQRVALPERTGRPALVFLGGEAYALVYPAGGALRIRDLTCDDDACVVSDAPTRIPLGAWVEHVAGVPLSAPDGTADGLAIAYERGTCAGGLPEVEVLVLDRGYQAVALYPLQTDAAEDVRIATRDTGADADRVRSIWLGVLLDEDGPGNAAIYLGGVALPATCSF